MKRCFSLACALLFAIDSSACPAGPNEQLVRVVTYSDDDLSSPKLVAALHRRIEYAINQVCADPTGPSPGVTIDASCKADAWANIRAQMETPVASRPRKDNTAFLIRISRSGR